MLRSSQPFFSDHASTSTVSGMRELLSPTPIALTTARIGIRETANAITIDEANPAAAAQASSVELLTPFIAAIQPDNRTIAAGSLPSTPLPWDPSQNCPRNTPSSTTIGTIATDALIRARE